MIKLPMAALVPNEPMRDDERQMTRGISGCHNQLNKLAEHVFEASAQIGAMASVLQARGLISEQELAEQTQAEQERLLVLFQQREIGVQMDMRVPDKYALPPDSLPQIDCESRYHLCHAACCALRFALSKQDLEEGVMRWELAEPYRNRVGPDQRCVHLDRNSHHCSIYEHRPGICRTYDCRGDGRIWSDFEQGVINPELIQHGPDGTLRFHFAPPEDQQAPTDAAGGAADGL